MEKPNEMVATEAMPVDQMTREQMLEELKHAMPGIDYSENTDDELRAEVHSLRTEFAETATEDPGEGETPAEEKQAEEVPATEQQPANPQATIARLQAEIRRLQTAGKAGKRVASGSKARPNVKYKLLEKAPGWTNTPQVTQLQQILFSPDVLNKYKAPDGTVIPDGKSVIAEIPEPELFDIIRAGHAAGTLKTSQDPVRIFQYYRSNLIDADVLRMV